MISEDHLGPEKKEKIEQLVREVAGSFPHKAYLEEMIETALKLGLDETDRGDIKLVNSTLKEMRRAFHVFSRYRDIRKVAAFGSARVESNTPEYRMGLDFARKMAQRGFMIITGAAGGIMRACNEGAGKAKSFGINIRLPLEQKANEFIAADKLLNFKYFFTRKLVFVKESDAVALFPGGFGTMDEAFELFTLVQTGKSSPRPIVLLDMPGGSYWKNWEAYIRENILEKGLIAPSDMHLFYITHDVDAAVRHITDFYRVYHSCRYVGKRLIMRLNQRITDATLAQLNREFNGILVKGQIERAKPQREEVQDSDELSLPRLAFWFDHKNYGVLRQLIDQINRET